MSTRKIIVKAKGAGLSEFERFVEQALHDLQNNTDEEFSRSLQTLYLCSAKEVPVGQGRKAVVLFVPGIYKYIYFSSFIFPLI
jgi:small subunit ribosomal protein S7e